MERPAKNFKSIQIPVPAEMPDTTIELLRATLQAIVSLRCDCSSNWHAVLHRLQEDEWKVQWRFDWVAEARRDSVYEQASGHTLDEAFAQLGQLTSLHLVDNTP